MLDAIDNPKPIIVSLKNGKVYVGLPERVSSDPNDPTKWLRIAVHYSGYREGENKSVRFDKNYLRYLDKLPEGPKHLLLVLPWTEIVSIGYFSLELTDKLISANLAAWGPDKKDSPISIPSS